MTLKKKKKEKLKENVNLKVKQPLRKKANTKK